VPQGPESAAAEPAEDGGAFRIQAVDRAVLLLKSVAASATPPTVLELARACGINRSTAWPRSPGSRSGRPAGPTTALFPTSMTTYPG
jgi:hypothetical protein